MKNFVEINRASTGAKKTFNFKSFFSSIGQKTDCRRAGKNEEKSKTTRKRLENDSKTIQYVKRALRYAATVLLLLCLGVGNVWGTEETFTFAWTSAGTAGYSYSQAGPTGGTLLTNNAIYFVSNEGPKVDASKLNPYRVGFVFKPTANVTLTIKGSAGSSARTIQNIKIDEEIDARLYSLYKDAVGASKTVMKYALDNASDEDKAFYATVGILKISKGVYSVAGDAKSVSGQTAQSSLYDARVAANNISVPANGDNEVILNTGSPAENYTFEAGTYYRVYTEVSSSTGAQLVSFTFTDAGGVTSPSFSPTTGGSLVKSSGTVTLTSSENTVYYKWSQTDNQYASSAGSTLAVAADGSGTSPVNATAPSTAGTWYLYAVAYDGDAYSNVVKATYTITNPTHTLTWNLDGGTATGGTAAGAVEEGASLTAPTVTKVGYDFAGWSPNVPSTMPSDDATYTATWTKVYASGTYNFVNQGDGSVTWGSSHTVTLPAGTKTTVPAGSRVDNIFFSTALDIEYEKGAEAGTGYKGWKIKQSGKLAFYVENDCDVIVTNGIINGMKIHYYNQSNVETNTNLTSTTGTREETAHVKGGTLFEIVSTTTSTNTLKGIRVSSSCTAPTTTFGNGEYTVGGSALDLSTLIGSNNSSGAITYTVKTANGTGASISTASFTATTAGTCTVTATQAANGDKCEKVMDATITVNATPSISSFSPASGSTIKSGTTITVSGSSSSTVYCLWASSTPSASDVKGGTVGTSGAAAVTSAGIASANGTTLYAVATRGGATSSISSASYTIDDTAPTLSSSNPANGATGVATSGTIVLTFSEEIANVDGSKFTLTGATIGAVAKDGSNNMKVNIAYSGAANSATVTLATTAGAVSDAAGNTSAALSSISFTTEAAATYTVTYNGSSPDGGSVPEDANSPYESGATVTVLGNTGNLTKAFEPEPSELVPATFIGWNTNSNTYGGTHYDANDQFTISGNTTLYAVWGYPIAYDADGGTINDASYPSYYICTYPDDDATTTLPSDVTKTGYDFDGWYTENGSGTIITEITGDSTGAFSGDHALKAIWTANSYTITLNKGDHGAANQSASVLYDATALTSITHVTATGYDRTGYFDGSTKVLNADGSFADNDITGYITDGKWSKTADASLTAKWSAQTYTISYKDQGDNTYSGSNGGSLPTSHTYGSATDFVNGVKSGYRFMGWYTDASCTVSAGSSIGAMAITANTTYYAKWARLYTITNGEPSNGTITVVTEAIEGETVSITASPNSEYNFDAWSVYKTGDPETTITPAAATASTSFTMPAYGVTVDATFVVKTYSVTYNGNGRTGGSAVPTDATAYTSGQTVTVKAGSGMAKTGYTFIGWLSGDNTLYQYGQTFTITANTTLTAQWDGTGSSITLTNFETSKHSKSNNKPDSQNYYLYGYKGSVSNANAVTLTTTSSNNYGQNSGVEIRVDNSSTLRIYASNATSETPASFSRITSVSFQAKLYNSGNTERTTGYTIYAGGTSVATGNVVGVASDGYKNISSGTFSEKNGYVDIVLGSGNSNNNLYVDNITITCATNTAKTVTFNKGSGPSTVTGLPAAVKVPSGSKIARPATDPSATNYIFSGWVTTSGGSSPFNFASTTISSNTTIYASWEAKTAPTQYTFSLSDPCASASPSATLSGSQSGWSYQLFKDDVASGDPKAGTGNALTWTGLTAGSYYVKTVETSTQATERIGDAATVYAATAISSNIATSRSVSANVSSTISFVASGYSLSYQWYTCNSDGTGKVAIDGKDAPQFTYTFTNSDAPTKYICCVATGTCGTVTSNIQTVTITPTYLLTYDANGGNGAPAAAYRAATTAALSSTQPTRSNHRFLGWNTEDDGSGTHYAAGASFPMPAEATTLYAEWQEEASLQWVPNLNTGESSIGTNSKSSTNTTRIPTSAMSAISNYGSLTITSSAKSDLTSKIQAPTSYDAGKYMYVTFTVPANYEFVPSSASVKVQPVDGAGDVQLELYDANGHSISKTQSSVASGSSTTITMTNDLGVALNGTVTLKIYCYGGSTGTYRLGSPIAISGDVNYECPERPTVTTPASVQNINVGAYDKQTLTVAATPYADGALSYQWMKDGVEIDGATSTTYVVDASTIGFGATAAYTCVVTEEGACAPAVSPAYNITVPVLVTQPIRVGGSSSWNGDGSAAPDMTFNDPTSTLTQNAVITWTGYTFTATNVGKSKDGQEDATDKFTGVPSSSTKDADYYLSLKFNSPSHNVRIAEVNVPIMAVSNNVTVQVTVSDGTTTVTSEALTATQTSAGTVIHLQFTFSSTPFILNAGTIELRIYVYNQSSDTGFRLGTPVTINGGVLTQYVYTGDGADENWSTTGNWNWGKLPMAGDNVVLQKPVTVDNTDAVANNVVIDKSGGNTGKLTIAADGMLIAAGTIRANGDAQTAVEDVVINTSKTSQGALIFDNPSGSKQTKGTVNFYTRSYRDNTSKKLQWQYVGIPFDDVTDEVYGGLYVNKYSETAGSWTVMRYQGDRSISAWDGLAISGDEEGYAPISGTFTSTEDKDITLTHSAAAGENLIGNSWTAPIQIADLEESDFGDATATIYLFNTGRYKTSEGSGSSTESGTKEHTAGQWMTIPISSAASGVWAGMKVIPAFNAFEVITSSEATLSLGYSKVVASATNDVNAEMRAPVRRTSAKDIDGYRIRVADELTYTDMYLFEDITFTTGHDNGWDGDYMPCDGRSAQLYAQTALGKLAVAALPDLEGTVLGFKPGQSTEYTFSFGTNAGGYYLNDLKMQESTLIQEGNTYTFNWEDGDSTNRFIISATPYKMPTGIENGEWMNGEWMNVKKVLIDDHLYIIRAGKIFDATGNRVK